MLATYYVSADTNRGNLQCLIDAISEAHACRSFRATMPDHVDIYDLFAVRASTVSRAITARAGNAITIRS